MWPLYVGGDENMVYLSSYITYGALLHKAMDVTRLGTKWESNVYQVSLT